MPQEFALTFYLAVHIRDNCVNFCYILQFIEIFCNQNAEKCKQNDLYKVFDLKNDCLSFYKKYCRMILFKLLTKVLKVFFTQIIWHTESNFFKLQTQKFKLCIGTLPDYFGKILLWLWSELKKCIWHTLFNKSNISWTKSFKISKPSTHDSFFLP
jgi:hypothetical protein